MANAHKEDLTKMQKAISVLWVILGAIIAAYGLEAILIPSGVIDGGITGVSIMLRELTGLSLSVWLIILNLPFIVIGYKQLGFSFAMLSTIGILSLSIAVNIFHHTNAIIADNPFLVIVTGGIALGVGIGIVLRNGGVLDGSEVLAVLFSQKLPFSVGEIIMAINLVIFTAAAFVFGIESAISSAIAYYIAAKMIDLVQTGMSESKAVMIFSEHNYVIGDAISARLGRNVTYFEGEGGYGQSKQMVLYVVINRLEESKLKTIVKGIDPNKFMTITDIAEVRGANFKRNIH